jgi:ribulose 1,5-bisphosphate synthetase/thiazole synthase
MTGTPAPVTEQANSGRDPAAGDVLVVGAGPTGLTAACEPARP